MKLGLNMFRIVRNLLKDLATCATALRSIAESQRLIAGQAYPEKRSPKKTEVFTPSIAEQNRMWQAERDAELFGGADADH
jgi:hypothetical protein